MPTPASPNRTLVVKMLVMLRVTVFPSGPDLGSGRVTINSPSEASSQRRWRRAEVVQI